MSREAEALSRAATRALSRIAQTRQHVKRWQAVTALLEYGLSGGDVHALRAVIKLCRDVGDHDTRARAESALSIALSPVQWLVPGDDLGPPPFPSLGWQGFWHRQGAARVIPSQLQGDAS